MAADVRAAFSAGTAPAPPVPLRPVTVAVLGALVLRRREHLRRAELRSKALRRSGSWPLSAWWDETLGNCRE